MDYSDGVKYTLFRLLLMIGCGAVGVAAGKLLLWAAASVMPASWLTLKEFLVTDQAGSVTAAIVMAAMLGRVFYDDGKKHAAYENWDAILVSITHIVMLIVYFVPVIFYNPNDITRGVEFAYYLFLLSLPLDGARFRHGSQSRRGARHTADTWRAVRAVYALVHPLQKRSTP